MSLAVNSAEYASVVNGDQSLFTKVVVDKVCCEGRLLVFSASIHAGVGIRCVHRENICADAHQFCLPHQLPDGRGTRGQRSRQFLTGHPGLRSSVSGQLSFCSILLQAGGDSGLQVGQMFNIWPFKKIPVSLKQISMWCEVSINQKRISTNAIKVIWMRKRKKMVPELQEWAVSLSPAGRPYSMTVKPDNSSFSTSCQSGRHAVCSMQKMDLQYPGEKKNTCMII